MRLNIRLQNIFPHLPHTCTLCICNHNEKLNRFINGAFCKRFCKNVAFVVCFFGVIGSICFCVAVLLLSFFKRNLCCGVFLFKLCYFRMLFLWYLRFLKRNVEIVFAPFLFTNLFIPRLCTYVNKVLHAIVFIRSCIIVLSFANSFSVEMGVPIASGVLKKNFNRKLFFFLGAVIWWK